MCGRFNILTDVDTLLAVFEVTSYNKSEIQPLLNRYNISPSQRNIAIHSLNLDLLSMIPIVRLGDDGERVLINAIWPFIPVWAGYQIPKYSTANARSETMVNLASYRNAWKNSQRCLIPATGFYEWQSVSEMKNKQPWHIKHENQAIMAFAGLWERGNLVDGTPFESCTIVTTAANSLMQKIHNSKQRMPVIIDPENTDQWLDNDSDAALQLAVTYPNVGLQAYPISNRINNPSYHQKDCIEPVGLPH